MLLWPPVSKISRISLEEVGEKQLWSIDVLGFAADKILPIVRSAVAKFLWSIDLVCFAVQNDINNGGLWLLRLKLPQPGSRTQAARTTGQRSTIWANEPTWENSDYFINQSASMLSSFNGLRRSPGPRRSNLTSVFNSVPSITYIHMSLLPLSASISRSKGGRTSSIEERGAHARS